MVFIQNLVRINTVILDFMSDSYFTQKIASDNQYGTHQVLDLLINIGSKIVCFPDIGEKQFFARQKNTQC